MKKIVLILSILICATSLFSQQPTPTPTGDVGTSVSGPGITGLPAPQRPDSKLATAPQGSYTPPDAATRRKRFINSTFGPWALGRQVATAGMSTWGNSPEEWGTKWEGFGRRVASNFAKNAIKQTIKFGLDEALKVDSHFYRSKDKSVKARIGNALISPVAARNRDGKRVIGVPNLVGTYASGIISREAWYPSQYGWKDGVRSGTISLGFAAAYNLFREFVWKK